ncbi:hypothetical protein [Streptomyces sp. NPDC058424]|uniref:hypothetical protein n=1 Tax=Streptomyces sp. NPDC058424 TaxID=3346491 RepID=UPI00365BE482
MSDAEEKLAQLDQPTSVNLGMPDLSRIVGRTVITNEPGRPWRQQAVVSERATNNNDRNEARLGRPAGLEKDAARTV